jgi:hypothetical protein
MRRRPNWRSDYRGGAIVLLIVASGCAAVGVASSSGTAPSSTASTLGSGTLDCPSLLGASPSHAAELLEAAGYLVSWRTVHTNSDGTSAADVVASPPQGIVVDIILDRPQALIFVTTPEDLAAVSPPPLTC